MAGEGEAAVRKRSRCQTRSSTPLDLRKAYLDGLAANLFTPFDVPQPKETDFQILFCKEILRTDANHFEALALLGDAYTRNGEFEKGLEADLKLSSMKPEHKLVRYNLACSYALTGQKDKAFLNLHKAVELGYRDVEQLRQDRDLDAIKPDPRFQHLIKKLSAERPRKQGA